MYVNDGVITGNDRQIINCTLAELRSGRTDLEVRACLFGHVSPALNCFVVAAALSFGAGLGDLLLVMNQ